MLHKALGPAAVAATLLLIGCGSNGETVDESDAAGADDGVDSAIATDTDVASDGESDGAVTETGVVDTGADTTGPPGPLGATCTSDAQCASGVCLSIGRCSKPCAGATDCPSSPNWSCVALPGRGPTCDCNLLSANDIACNNVDDNCDGRIDESSRVCGGACVDVMTNPNHCGACGLVCGGGTVCQAGACVCPPDKPTVCGSKCVNTTNDPTNCGTCATSCPTGPNGIAACTAGSCSLSCTAPFGNCNGSATDGCEKDLRGDLSNCGMCGRTCAFPNAGAVCSTGSCVLSACNAGYANCDSDPTNGCETDVASSLASCGACGKACAPANGTGACTAGTCELVACKPGYANCNASATDGCEASLQSDRNNCGTCGKVCPGTGAPNMVSSCNTGVCGVACNTGYGNCDGNVGNGCETDLRSSTLHCGACGNTCSAGQSCVSGVCSSSSPVDVMILLGVTGSTWTSLDAAIPSLQSRLVAPLLAMPDVQVGVSYTADFPVSPYGVSGDRAFQGGIETITTASTINGLIASYPKLNGNDEADGMIEGLGSLSGLGVHPTSLGLTCSSGRVAGGCWRSGARRIIVLFTDDIFHNGPNPATPALLYSPYTGITPAPHAWPAVKAAMISQNIKLLIMNSHGSGASSPGAGQHKLMLSELGQPLTDTFIANTASSAGTAADAVVARIAAIRSGG